MKRSLTALFVALVFGMTFWFGRCTAPESPAGALGADAGAATTTQLWTCPMHPQVVLPNRVPCPLCGMELVPFDATADASGNQIRLGPGALALAGVRTAPVERRRAELEVQLVGTIEVPEDAVRTIAATVPGRIERLFVNTTGIRVRAGDHLFELFSPELLTAQEELIGAREQLDRLGDEATGFLRESAERALGAARTKLELWQLGPERIAAIESSKQAKPRITIDAPVSGTVVARHVDQGDYLAQGGMAFEVAELDRLWLELEAFEQDLPFLRYGQKVAAQVEAWPGRTFHGLVSFVDPMVDARTRTSTVRVLLDNPDGALKPGMFARASVHARLDQHGRVRTPELAGKWISPMHPEVVSDEPGSCWVCGMDLVPAEDLGLVGESAGPDPLVVPRGAVLWTGRRSLVYVELEGASEPTFAAREVELGSRAGELQVVLGGLEPGERVVVEGAFRIDSAMQIRARPSMLSQPAEPLQEAALESAVPPSEEQAAMWRAYLELGRALAADDAAAARGGLAALAEAARAASEAEPTSTPSNASLAALAAAAEALDPDSDLEALRAGFEAASDAARALLAEAGNRGEETLFEAFCPMAFEGRGARWLQAERAIANPYFGAQMLRCGTIESEHSSGDRR